MSRADYYYGEGKEIGDAAVAMDVKKAIEAVCTEDERMVIALDYCDYTQRQIADRMGTSQQNVSRLYDSAVRKIAAFLGEPGPGKATPAKISGPPLLAAA